MYFVADIEFLLQAPKGQLDLFWLDGQVPIHVHVAGSLPICCSPLERTSNAGRDSGAKFVIVDSHGLCISRRVWRRPSRRQSWPERTALTDKRGTWLQESPPSRYSRTGLLAFLGRGGF